MLLINPRTRLHRFNEGSASLLTEDMVSNGTIPLVPSFNEGSASLLTEAEGQETDQ